MPCPIPCVVERAGSEEAEKALISDLSLRGARLRLAGGAEARARLLLSFSLGSEHLEKVPADVVWCRAAEAGYDCGVGFAAEWAAPIERALLGSRGGSVLLIEDDAGVRAALEGHLAGAGCLVDAADGVAEGWRKFEERPFDLLVVDLSLPDGDGMDLVGKVRAHPKRFSTPVMILTADASTMSKVAGLAFGADQYLVKPVDPSEFLFSAAALLRRLEYKPKADGVIRFERGEIDPRAHVVRLGESEFSNLSKKEFDLLYLLIAMRPRVLSKREMLSRLWNGGLAENTVESHVRRVREKLGAEGPRRLLTVSGRGYKFI